MGANFVPSVPSDVGAEPALGNPASDGMHLVSTAGGSRSWSTAPQSYPRGTAFPGSPSAGDAYYRTDRKILYVYEGSWQPIESYGDVTLYLSSTGSDANDGFSSGAAKATLAGVWATIPRLFGGNITVNVTGTINVNASTRLGGKYPVSGAYGITFLGAVGGLSKNSFSGTVNETAGNEGLISGLSGMSSDAFKGMLLYNATNNWYSVVYTNDTTSVRAVGKFNKPLTARTVASTDTWRIYDFGASFNYTGAYNIDVETENVTFERIRFWAGAQTVALRIYKTNCLLKTSVALGNGASFTNGFLCYQGTTVSFFDTYVEAIAFAYYAMAAFPKLEGVGATLITPAVNSSCLQVNPSSLVYFLDVWRFKSSNAGTGKGIIVGSHAAVLLWTSAVAVGSWIQGMSVGIEAQAFGVATSIHAKVSSYLNTVTQTSADATTANGVIS